MKLKNPKAKGSALERRVKKGLEADRFFVVKAAGSLGIFDLVALAQDNGLPIYENPVYLVQVKANRPPGKKEMEALRAFQAPSYATKWLVVIKDRKAPVWTEIP